MENQDDSKGRGLGELFANNELFRLLFVGVNSAVVAAGIALVLEYKVTETSVKQLSVTVDWLAEYSLKNREDLHDLREDVVELKGKVTSHTHVWPSNP